MFKRLFVIVLCVCMTATGVYAYADTLELSAKSAILLEQESGRVLFEKNSDERLPPASVTKVMTLLLAMEALDSGKIALDDVVVASERAKSMGGSTIFLDAGEEMSVNDLLKGIVVASGNDACVAMAEYIAGSEESFVAMMNTRAAELGMANTHFVNTNGLDADGHYSSARDIGIMSRELLKHERIFDYTTIWTDSLRDGKFQLANTNKLIRFYKGANGLKTGSTSKAQCCLSGSAERDGLQLICVVMAAPTSKQRFGDATKMLDYGFANYELKQIVAEGESVGMAEVQNGTKNAIAARTAKSYNALVSKGAAANVAREVVYDEKITAPIREGDKIGEMRLTDESGRAVTVEIVAAEGADKMTYAIMLERLAMMWLGSVR